MVFSMKKRLKRSKEDSVVFFYSLSISAAHRYPLADAVLPAAGPRRAASYPPILPFLLPSILLTRLQLAIPHHFLNTFHVHGVERASNALLTCCRQQLL
jgi:hypothetical protein